MAEFDDRRLADVWTGTGDITLFAARGEELADLAPVRTGVGFRASMSYSVTDVHAAGRVAGRAAPVGCHGLGFLA